MARILLVDDDPDILDSAQYLLEAEGYVVDTARHGQEALARLAAHRPDVILLDLMMPVMDGWQFAEELHKTSCADVPVVVLSASHGLAEQAQAVRAKAHLAKPFEIHELVKKIDAVLPH